MAAQEAPVAPARPALVPPQDNSRHRKVERTQLTVLLAWVPNGHQTQGLRAQGLSMEQAVLDLGRDVFEAA